MNTFAKILEIFDAKIYKCTRLFPTQQYVFKLRIEKLASTKSNIVYIFDDGNTYSRYCDKKINLAVKQCILIEGAENVSERVLFKQKIRHLFDGNMEINLTSDNIYMIVCDDHIQLFDYIRGNLVVNDVVAKMGIEKKSRLFVKFLNDQPKQFNVVKAHNDELTRTLSMRTAIDEREQIVEKKTKKDAKIEVIKHTYTYHHGWKLPYLIIRNDMIWAEITFGERESLIPTEQFDLTTMRINTVPLLGSTMFVYNGFDLIGELFGVFAEHVAKNIYNYRKCGYDETTIIDYVIHAHNLLNSEQWNLLISQEHPELFSNIGQWIHSYMISQIRENNKVNPKDVATYITEQIHGATNIAFELPLCEMPYNIIPLLEHEYDRYNGNVMGQSLKLADHINSILPQLTDINLLRNMILRTCIKRYQFEQYNNSFTIAKCILRENIEMFDEIVDTTLQKLMNIFTEQYKTKRIFNKIQFVTDFLTLTGDFSLPQKDLLDSTSMYVRTKYINLVYKFITDVIDHGNIRNRLFMVMTFCKVLHYSLIRKLFIIFYLQDQHNGLDDPEIKRINTYAKKLGIYKNHINSEDWSSSDYDVRSFNVSKYCEKNGLNEMLIKQRYDVTVPIFNEKMGSKTTWGKYLTEGLDANRSDVFILFIFNKFKNLSAGRIRIGSRKKAACFADTVKLYPSFDEFEFNLRANVPNCNQFTDRGIDGRVYSVLDDDNNYMKAFMEGEYMLSGPSGHTVEGLICIGCVTPDMDNFVNIMKCFTLIAISAMFPRKDHSIHEIYRALEVFENVFPNITGNQFTCDSNNANQGRCLYWLLDGLQFNYNGKQMDGSKTSKCIKEELGHDISFYLSSEYALFVKRIILLANATFTKATQEFADLQVTPTRGSPSRRTLYMNHPNINKDLKAIVTATEKLVEDSGRNPEKISLSEVSTIYYILNDEYTTKNLTDKEYVYFIEQTAINRREFINAGLALSPIHKQYELNAYEDNATKCYYDMYQIPSSIMTKNDMYIILHNYFRTGCQ